MRKMIDLHFGEDTPIESLSRTELEFEFEKLKWLWVRDSLNKDKCVHKLHELGYDYCIHCHDWQKDVCKDCRDCEESH